MPIFTLTLQPTYYKMGFFNVTVDFDRYVRKSEGPMELRLGGCGQVIEGRVDRHTKPNPYLLPGAQTRSATPYSPASGEQMT